MTKQPKQRGEKNQRPRHRSPEQGKEVCVAGVVPFDGKRIIQRLEGKPFQVREIEKTPKRIVEENDFQVMQTALIVKGENPWGDHDGCAFVLSIGSRISDTGHG